MELEIWKIIPNCNENYEISEYGLVRNVRTGRILKPSIDKDGYLSCLLSLGSRGKVIRRSVHSFVAESFLGARPEGMQVNHKDGIKSHNHFTNLEYSTPKENTEHAWSMGLSKKQTGENNSNSKLTSEQVLFIKSQYGIQKATDLSRKFGVTQSNISHIWAGDSWRTNESQ